MISWLIACFCCFVFVVGFVCFFVFCMHVFVCFSSFWGVFFRYAAKMAVCKKKPYFTIIGIQNLFPYNYLNAIFKIKIKAWQKSELAQYFMNQISDILHDYYYFYFLFIKVIYKFPLCLGWDMAAWAYYTLLVTVIPGIN